MWIEIYEKRQEINPANDNKNIKINKYKTNMTNY